MNKYKVLFVGGGEMEFSAHDCTIRDDLFIFHIYSDLSWREKPHYLRGGLNKVTSPIRNVLAVERI